MRHGSLFSGIGGFDLAAEWMGWDNVFHCEWMPFPRQVLHYHFPKSLSYEDITKTDFTIHRGSIDILTGGFPCQPFSLAGKRKGKDDERYLWGEMLRAIQEIKPKFIIGENVYGITNIDGGLVFEKVCLDLEDEGYEVQPFVIPACAKNAPHRRDRVWFVATNSDNLRQHQCECINEEFTSKGWEYALNDFDKNVGQGVIINTNSERFKGCLSTELIGQFSNEKSSNEINLLSNGRRREELSFERFPTQSPICGGDDGLPTQLDGITFSK